ncbi:MAG: hypothetical protein U0L77_10290 [Prevotellamassilia sp.]|nr:hypothetical protein [Prevotellamassilia sp.]
MDIDLRDLQRLCRPHEIVGTDADGHQLKHQAHCRQKLALTPRCALERYAGATGHIYCPEEAN